MTLGKSQVRPITEARNNNAEGNTPDDIPDTRRVPSGGGAPKQVTVASDVAHKSSDDRMPESEERHKSELKLNPRMLKKTSRDAQARRIARVYG